MGCLNVQRCRQQSQLVIYQIMYSMNVLALVTESDGNIFAHRCNMHIDAGHNVYFPSDRMTGYCSRSQPTVPSNLPSSHSGFGTFPYPVPQCTSGNLFSCSSELGQA